MHATWLRAGILARSKEKIETSRDENAERKNEREKERGREKRRERNGDRNAGSKKNLVKEKRESLLQGNKT